MAAARIQRWAITLGAYRYRLQHKPGRLLYNADALSRLPIPSQHASELEDFTPVVLSLDQQDIAAVPTKQLQALTATDDLISQVCKYTRSGWPRGVKGDGELSEYYKKRYELSVENDLLYCGHRVVVPTAARKKFLMLLHDSHQGVSSMKARARSIFWWPGLDQDIQRVAANCNNCVQALPMPPAQTPVNWPETGERWSRLHIDYAGPLRGKMVLIVVDSHSKWIEAVPVAHANSRSTVENLRTMFAQFGIPRTVVSDNGTPFTGFDFRQFMERNGIVHIRTSPHHPQSNGLAERAVRTVKDGLKKIGNAELTTSLARVLCNYRNTPQQSGLSPSERLLGYRLRTRLDLSFPTRNHHSVSTKPTEDTDWNFTPGQSVYVRNYGTGDKWTPGRVRATTGARLLEVETEAGIVRRHMDQVRRCDKGLFLESKDTRESVLPDNKATTEDAKDASAEALLRLSTRTKHSISTE
ncbi:uncharacterized protein K02A2.6-like [Rhipicephalus sanguineus]|uniref:uncharacterized protein K02A2.6-like n=1 Tax=Rhipicephalus sanguineus TaxID=34632 RepID=UPI001895E18D|nr:uncharacterized protein K02A2.6-like [Rhipicephalus sanguineus]